MIDFLAGLVKIKKILHVIYLEQYLPHRKHAIKVVNNNNTTVS